MNERLNKLEAQCWEARQYGPPWFNSAKFAKLIVRECVDICNEHPSRILSNNWHPTTVARDIALVLEEHFGVEE